MTTPTAASLLHLVDRAERGSLLAEEAQQLRNGIRALGVRGQEVEQLRADLARVQQAACRTAEILRHTKAANARTALAWQQPTTTEA